MTQDKQLIQQHTRPWRPWLDHIARLLLFVGVWALIVGAPTLSDTAAGRWWLLTALGLCGIGLLAQRLSTPKPLKPFTMPPGWIWLLFTILVLPLALAWFEWEWPWTWLLVVVAAVVACWAAYLPEQRRQVILRQYQQQNHVAEEPTDS